MLWRRRDPQTQAARETERRQETHETAGTRGDPAGSVPGGTAGWPQTLAGINERRVAMLQTLMPFIVLLSWLALPVTLVCIVDDWLLRPRRMIAAGAQAWAEASLMRVLYGALPLLIACAVLRLLLAERLDFSAVLLAITLLTGLVWALDVWLLAPRRAGAARAARRVTTLPPQPGAGDYARSFFPVALVVLLLRSFIFEPFRIPSDSMMP